MKPGTCAHFRGAFHETTCLAGVHMRDLVGGDDLGWVTRLPCITTLPSRNGERVSCNRYQEPTAEQIREHEEYIERATQRMLRTLPLIARIKEEREGEAWQGSEECPECGGTLHLSHTPSNGHVWGRCETEGCLQWME